MWGQKKGAMFGLDARIALAIFGALSVISGAALYNAVQEARLVSFYAEVQELQKEVEHMVLDVGNFPKIITRLYPGQPNAAYLATNWGNVPGWKGPYGNYVNPVIETETIFHNKFGKINFASVKPTGCNGDYDLTAGSAYYMRIHGVSNCEIDFTFAKAVHDRFDNDGDYTAGDIIVFEDSGEPGKSSIAFKLSSQLMD